jgi:hypothetical protein
VDSADHDRFAILEYRVRKLEDDADRQRVNRRQMLGLLIGSIMAFAGTLLIALLNPVIFT